MYRKNDSLNLTEQISWEWQRSGINFRIMLIGESGLGKTTFTRALLRPYVPEHLLDDPGGKREPVRARTTEITEVTHQVENDGFPCACPSQTVMPLTAIMQTSPFRDAPSQS